YQPEPRLRGVVLTRIEKDDPAASTLEPERNVDKPGKLLSNAFVISGIGKQQHESAAAGAEQFAAERPGASRRRVNLVDDSIRNLFAEASLCAPRLVKQLPKRGKVGIPSQDLEGFVDHAGHRAQLLFDALHIRRVALGDGGRRALYTCEEQHQVGVQRRQALWM